MRLFITIGLFISSITAAHTASYYIDFEKGLDVNTGTSIGSAWKHCPGDINATATAAACKLAAGDSILFKGAVRYRGSIECTWSGSKSQPIKYMGSHKSGIGSSPAIIDGSQAIQQWKKCGNSAEAGGNPLWENIYYADISYDGSWRTFNLCDADLPLPIAQSPNPKDPMFQDRTSDFFASDNRVIPNAAVTVYHKSGTWLNSKRPLSHVISPAPGSAIVSPIGNAEIHVTTNVKQTITEFGIAMQKGATEIKELRFLADKKFIMSVQLKRGDWSFQRFQLPKAITASDFGFHFASSWEKNPKADYTAIKRVGAWDAAGKNILEVSGADSEGMCFTDEQRFTQSDPDYYTCMTFCVHGGHNMALYADILGFDPKTHTIKTSSIKDTIYKTSKYSLLNSVKLIDIKGEYALQKLSNGRSRIFVYPRETANKQPLNIGYAIRERAFHINNQKHIHISGFKIERQSGKKSSPVEINGSQFITIDNCEVANASGYAALHSHKSSDILFNNCNLHHLPIKTRGLSFRGGSRCDAIGCTIYKPTGTALVYLETSGGRCSQNTVSGFHGMHSNGLTFYVKNKDLIIDRNHVFNGKGNVPLTIQEATNIEISNNVFDGDGSMCLGIWTAVPLKNVRIIHNTLINSHKTVDWQAALFSNSKGPDGLVIKNNIIDSLYGVLPGERNNNIYIRLEKEQIKSGFEKSSMHIEKMSSVIHETGDAKFHLVKGSPAIGAASSSQITIDYTGKKRDRADIGAIEFSE
ncbi:MAG: right-handed parallel beta-helix repeat-containing protein [Planctomycetes bacterium]|nr:right-handed parallel beta-helix repeat-containing protein [Planctomycetota bacterium]